MLGPVIIIFVIVVLFVMAVVRWLFRINTIVSNQEKTIELLKRIANKTKDHDEFV
jgi:hypothetical protein